MGKFAFKRFDIIELDDSRDSGWGHCRISVITCPSCDLAILNMPECLVETTVVALIENEHLRATGQNAADSHNETVCVSGADRKLPMR